MRHTSIKTLLATMLALLAFRGAAQEPLFRWRPAVGDTVLNHNAAAFGSAVAFDSIPYAGEYTLVAVYRAVSDSDAAVWSLRYGDGEGYHTRALTTGRIVSDSVSVRYRGVAAPAPSISALRQTAPDSVSPRVRLELGGCVAVAEVLYYGTRLGAAALRGVQSLLAVRYGVTLGPVDWRIGGNTVWVRDSVYKYRVTGVGADSAAGLYQAESRSEMGGALLSVSADTLPDGVFLLAADDGGEAVFRSCDGVELLGRGWKVRTLRASGVPFTLTFDMGGIALPGDTLVLLVDGEAYPAYSTAAGKTVFRNVLFDTCDSVTGTSYMTLGRGGALLPKGKKSRVAATPVSFAASLYPNPTGGRYTLEVEGAGEVRVTVYNVQGAVMATFSAEGRGPHRFEGELPPGGIYYATVATDSGSQTLKLVVN